ncbi:ABC transporter ATP-binding protein [Niallia circulans]|uniref:thiol reductant ABC exporter subunit CydD n=1 Tax=Niallia circulans TaxID=1397 RepID=UPI00077CBC53|nr:thiol reductant ABC exporter subunit CydD [Niallia circulans]MDR4316869.1 thiol reductant ABC exporter subunit CydD [Niallia circulans]MED3840135.1 thiol reductant ABC exporter subunit CydD [Niallia circulans]MED4241823.1 thiol reductant ABC exporter subunit CydD [Niallia circulans]MED4250227.1 thiol reductant ABC exporter subunit CydD [Niallia circulans]QKH63567.1 thiol reductant ABC exporter subunit CydD [Niallia circulans]
MDKNLLKLTGIKPILATIGILTIVEGAAIILQAKWLAEIIASLYNGENYQEQYVKIILFLLAFLGRHFLHTIQQNIAAAFAEKTSKELRLQLMQKLFELGPKYTKKQGSGNIATLVLEGISQYRTYLELFLPRMLATGIVPGMIILYVFWNDWLSGVILTVTMPILIGFLILVGMAASSQMNRQLATYKILSNHFLDSLRGLDTLKFLGRSKQHSGNIEKVSEQYRGATMKTLRLAFLSSFSLDFFTSLSVAVVAVNLGLRLINGDLVLLPALMILILAPEFFLPVRMVGADYHATLDGKEAGDAIQTIIQTQKSAKMTGQSISLGTKPSLTFDHVTFQHHPEEKATLKDLSFMIDGYKKIGIVGESGAGKSTLIDLLSGFSQHCAGSISVNSVSLPSLMTEEWRQLTTYIPQSPYIFSMTLRENISFYQPDAADEEIIQALKATGLYDIFTTFPNGLDELLGDGGRNLSGGQEQRIALARAFLTNRKIMLLDEPTSHLDIETEFELKETMLPLFNEKLVFLATHRLHWMKEMDSIIVMDQGTIVESGTHEELVAAKGFYYKLLQQ